MLYKKILTSNLNQKSTDKIYFKNCLYFFIYADFFIFISTTLDFIFLIPKVKKIITENTRVITSFAGADNHIPLLSSTNGSI